MKRTVFIRKLPTKFMLKKILPIALGAFVIFGGNFASNAIEPSALESVENVKCAAPGTPREALNRAAAVFIGKITKIEENDNVKTIKFAAERVWKGEKVKNLTISITTGFRYNPSFSEGERYLVYANKNQKGELTTGRCSRTKLAEYAEDDLRELGAGSEP